MRCFLRFRLSGLWVASSKVPKLRSAKRTFSAPWLELKSRIAPRLTWLWVRTVYVPHDTRHKYHTTCQLRWKKVLRLRRTTFRERKTRKKSSKSSKNNSKTQKNDDFCQSCHMFTNEIAQRWPFESPAEHLRNRVQIIGNSTEIQRKCRELGWELKKSYPFAWEVVWKSAKSIWLGEVWTHAVRVTLTVR